MSTPSVVRWVHRMHLPAPAAWSAKSNAGKTRPSRVDTKPRTAGLADLLAAAACALTAQRILLVAVPWLVLTETGSPTATALVSAAQVTPILFAKLFAGPLLDRVGAARIAVAGDLICAAGMLLLAAGGSPPLWLIAAVMAAVGAAQGPSAAAKIAVLAEVTSTGPQPTQWGTGLMTTVERCATTLGPALAGLLIAVVGGQRPLWLVAALFAGASLFARTYISSAPVAARRGYWRELVDGARFLFHDRSLTSLLVMYGVTNWLDEALLVILLPLWARAGDHSPAVIGAAISTAGAAAVGTALLAAYAGHRLPRRGTYFIAAVISGPTRFAALAAGLPPTAVLAVFAVSGLGSGLLSPLADAVQLERIPAQLRGRVFTLSRAVAWIGIPAGGITGAVLTACVGLTAALWICAAGYLAAAVYPSWRVIWNPPPDDQHLLPVSAGRQGPQHGCHP